MSSIRGKILLIVAVMAAGLILASSFAIYQVANLSGQSTIAVERLRSVVALVDTARSAQHHFKIQVQEWKNVIIRGGDPSLYDKYWGAFEKEEKIVVERLNQVSEIAGKLNVSHRIDPSQAITATQSLGEKYRAALASHDRSQPNFTQSTDKSVRGMDRDADTMIDALNKEAKKLAEEIETETVQKLATEGATTRISLIAISVLFLICGVGLSMIIANNLITRLVGVESGMKKVQTTHDLTIQVDVKGNDELTSMAQSFNSMLSDFRQVLSQVHSCSASVSSASSQISLTSNTLQNSASTQAEAVLTSAAATEELTTSISSVASYSGDIKTLSIDSVKDTVNGSRLVDELVSEISEVQTSVEGMAHAVEDFVTSTKTISAMTQQVKEIADQTNLLALNAAIEAARAGEQGRGFAIVADEVRKLAEKSNQSAHQIEAVTITIYSQSEGVANSIQSGLKSIDASVAKATQVKAALESSKQKVERANDGVNDIAASVKEQEFASLEIAKNMEQISQVTDQTSKASAEAQNAAEALLEMASGLQQMVNRFRT